MKVVGRIILLVVGALMLASAIKDIVTFVNGIKSVGGSWQQLLQALMDAQKRDQYWQYLTAFIKAIGLCIVAASALFAGIKGKGGFWFTIFSVGMIALFIWDVVEKNKAGTFSGENMWKAILQLVIDSATQLAYISGFILLKLSKDN